MKDKIYPLLAAKDISVDEAKIFLQTMNLVIEQAFTNMKRSMKISDLKEMTDQFAKDETAKDYQGLYEIIQDEEITSALDLIGSMGNMVVNNERQLMKDKKFAELPIRFITYENE